jgi:ArsR family transcriptional regulator
MPVKIVSTEEQLFDLADLFKIFGDTTRLKILYALRGGEVCEKCVGDIARDLAMTQSAISHQLRILKSNKLVKFRRDGKLTFYSLADDHVESILNQGMEHVLE